MVDEVEGEADPIDEAFDRLNAAGITRGLISGLSRQGEPGYMFGHGPQWLRLEHYGDLTEADRERIRLVMEDVPYEFVHVTTTTDGKIVLDDGTVIGGWLRSRRPDA